jgi:hypothetical protein
MARPRSGVSAVPGAQHLDKRMNDRSLVLLTHSFVAIFHPWLCGEHRRQASE